MSVLFKLLHIYNIYVCGANCLHGLTIGTMIFVDKTWKFLAMIRMKHNEHKQQNKMNQEKTPEYPILYLPSFLNCPWVLIPSTKCHWNLQKRNYTWYLSNFLVGAFPLCVIILFGYSNSYCGRNSTSRENQYCCVDFKKALAL